MSTVKPNLCHISNEETTANGDIWGSFVTLLQFLWRVPDPMTHRLFMILLLLLLKYVSTFRWNCAGYDLGAHDIALH